MHQLTCDFKPHVASRQYPVACSGPRQDDTGFSGHIWEKVCVCLQLLKLVRNSAGHIRSVRGWRTVCALITMTSLHPGTAATSFEALRVVTREKGLLSPASFAPCLETALTFVDRHAKVGSKDHTRAVHALWVDITKVSLVGSTRCRCTMHIQYFCLNGEELSCRSCIAAGMPATGAADLMPDHSLTTSTGSEQTVAVARVQEPFPERSIDSLNLVDAMFHWLVHWGRQQDLKGEAAAAQRRTLLGPPDSAGRLPTGEHLPPREASGQLLALKSSPCLELLQQAESP